MRTVEKEELQELAKEILEVVSPKGGKAAIVALSGDLGAGKTTLVQAIARELGVVEVVTSPTFVIERVYELPLETTRGFARLIHIDAYRLEDSRELERLGWHDVAADPKNLILIEWPEKVAGLIPPNAQRISLSYINEHQRHFSYGH